MAWSWLRHVPGLRAAQNFKYRTLFYVEHVINFDDNSAKGMLDLNNVFLPNFASKLKVKRFKK